MLTPIARMLCHLREWSISRIAETIILVHLQPQTFTHQLLARPDRALSMNDPFSSFCTNKIPAKATEDPVHHQLQESINHSTIANIRPLQLSTLYNKSRSCIN